MKTKKISLGKESHIVLRQDLTFGASVQVSDYASKKNTVALMNTALEDMILELVIDGETKSTGKVEAFNKVGMAAGGKKVMIFVGDVVDAALGGLDKDERKKSAGLPEQK